MKNCCGVNLDNLCDQLECDITETDKGIQVDIRPKDAAKKESLKAMVKGCRDFCGCC